VHHITSQQVVRLHDREESVLYDYPDLIAVVSRISYFDDQEMGKSWGSQIHPSFVIRPPRHDKSYRQSVRDPVQTNDVTGESEEYLHDTIQQLIEAIITDYEGEGKQHLLLHQEQLTPVPNDKSIRNQCLMNTTFSPMVNPFSDHSGSCGFGTRDARYGFTKSLDLEFGDNRFFVLVSASGVEVVVVVVEKWPAIATAFLWR